MGLQYAVICRLAPSFCGIEGCLCNLSAKYKHLSMSWKVCVWSTTLNPIINTNTNSIIYLHRYALYLLILFFCMTFTITFFAVTLIALTSFTSIFRHYLYPPPAALYALASIWAFLADHCPGLPPFEPALIFSNKRLRKVGLV